MRLILSSLSTSEEEGAPPPRRRRRQQQQQRQEQQKPQKEKRFDIIRWLQSRLRRRHRQHPQQGKRVSDGHFLSSELSFPSTVTTISCTTIAPRPSWLTQCSYHHHHTGETTSELLFYQRNLDDHSILMLANSLRQDVSGRITTLQLSKNKFGDVGAFALGKVLPTIQLERLSLNENPLIGLDGIRAIADSLQSHFPNGGPSTSCKLHPTLQVLSLSNNEMGPDMCSVLASMLRSNRSLRELCLHSNMIGNQGAKYLGQALQDNTTLRSLDASDNSIGHLGISALIDGLRTNTTLKHLFLGDNRVSLSTLTTVRDFLASDNATLLILDVKTHSSRCSALSSPPVYCDHHHSPTQQLDQKQLLECQMEHYLMLNRNGRYLVRQEPSRGLLGHIYAHAGNMEWKDGSNEPANMLYGLIREVPHLISL